VRLSGLAAGGLRTPLEPNPPIEQECGDRQDKGRREAGDPMEQNVHSRET